VIGVIVLLVAGAAAAAYAAWGKSSHARRPAAALARTLVTPAATTPGATGTTAGANPALGLGLTKPPKIPLKQVTPKAAPLPRTATTPASTGTTTNKTTTNKTTTNKTTTTPAITGGSGTNELPPAIELDTNAASTYDPYSYPAANFGDPSLAIDGDVTTGWTAQVEPAVAPKMAEGLAIDLRSPRSIADVKVYTSTTGMTVQVYGANGHALPGSITAPDWVPLSHALVLKKKSTTIKLRDATKAFSFIVVWISRAPESAIGTPQAPGHVVVDELELFPPR
jgi:hypothetical protein